MNKKLVPDPPKPPVEPQTTKKKTAWNIDTDATQRRFSGSADDDCTICCDPMANSAYKVACGHFFHEDVSLLKFIINVHLELKHALGFNSCIFFALVCFSFQKIFS